MRAVLAEIRLIVEKAVRALGRAVGPEVRSPAQPRGRDLAFARIIVQRLVATELLVDQTADRETGFVSIRLGIEAAASVASIGPAGKVDDLEIRKATMHEPNDLAESFLQRLGIGRESFF